jgi:hypothetical protein
VTRQYCGQLGKQDNCRVAVTLSLANHDASLPVAYRLYLPEDWAKDQARRHKVKVPETIAFQTKPEIAFRAHLRTSSGPAFRMDHTVIDAGDHRLSIGAISGAVGNDPYRSAPSIPLARRKTAVGASC